MNIIFLEILAFVSLFLAASSIIITVPNCSNHFSVSTFILRFVHYFTNLYFISFATFVSTDTEKSIYVVVTTLMILHWVIFDDCALTSMEKTNCSNIHFQVFFGSATNIVVVAYICLILINFAYTLCMFHGPPSELTIKSMLLIALAVVAYKSYVGYRT